MTARKKDDGRLDRMVDRAASQARHRSKSYRERALSMFPHVCGRCGRDFSGRKLRELTVHHKNHDHDHNPPDGSNWELLCIYCHDMEHQKYEMESGENTGGEERSPGLNQPFAALADLLKKEE